jgi:hypothetical protein
MRYSRPYNQTLKPVKWKYSDPARRITTTSAVTVQQVGGHPRPRMPIRETLPAVWAGGTRGTARVPRARVPEEGTPVHQLITSSPPVPDRRLGECFDLPFELSRRGIPDPPRFLLSRR